ncbi:MAG: CHAT domain-containing protein [Aureispira sp.]|nr:CHAT domain-containing protein [Aureispira sp.]
MLKFRSVFILIGCLLGTAMFAQTLEQDTAKASTLLKKVAEQQEAVELEKADATLRSILPLYAKHQLWAEEIEIRNYINKNIFNLGHKDSCLALYTELLTYTEEKLGKVSKKMASIYLDAGTHHVLAYKLDEALELFEQAEEIAIKTYGASDVFWGDLYSTKGICYVRKGDTHKAIEYYLNARKKYGKKITPSDNYSLSSNLVDAYYITNNKNAAMEEAKTFMASMQKNTQDYEMLAKAYKTVGLISYIERKYDKAVEYFRKSVNTLEKYNPELKLKISDGYSDLGTIYKDSYYSLDHNDSLAVQNCIDSAIYNVQKSIDIKHQVYGLKDVVLSTSYRSLGYIYFELKKDKEQALMAFHNSMLANLPLETNQDPFYVPDIASGTVVFPNYKNLYGAIEAKSIVFRDWYRDAKDKDPKHLDALLKYIDTMDDLLTQQLRKTSNINDQKLIMAAMHKVADWALRNYDMAYKERKDIKYLEKAFQYSENSKSIQLLSTLQTNEASQLGGLPEAIQIEEKGFQKKIDELTVALIEASKDKKNKIEGLEQELFEANQAYDVFINGLAVDYPNYFNLRYNNKNKKTVKELQAELLTEESVLLEYFFADRDIYTFKISKNSFELFNKQIDKAEAVDKIKAFYNTFEITRDRGISQFKAFVDGAYFMYNDLLQLNTIDPKEIGHLIIVPDGLLSYLPFELLISELPKDTSTIDYGGLSYLLHDYSIQYSYTAGLLLNKPIKTSYNRVLGLAASYDSSLIASTEALRSPDLSQLRANLQPLKGAIDEIKYLEKLYLGDYHFGAAANEGKFKKIDFSQYGIVHLAMHGVMNKDNPMASSLAFTENKDTTEDNFLNIYEITYMNIPVELVVLSACETGYGKFEDGEGVKSVARSFMYAGAASVLMTMWEVHDMAMSKIMADFYKNLEKGLTKSEAIQQAKLSYLKNAQGIAAHPFFWAPAIILGNDRPIHPAKPMSWLWILGGLVLGIVSLGAIVGVVKRSNSKKEKVA